MMERTRGRTPNAGKAPALGWRVFGQYLPGAIGALAAFLIIHNLTGGGDTAPPTVTVDANHNARLAANIAFFEERVAETKDSLSYNRLTGLYLQRLREAGDVADVRRAELSATKSLEAAPGDYAGLLNLAQVRLAQHDFESAATLARQAMSTIPTRTDANAILGDAQMALGQYDSAGHEYRVFLEKTPGFSAFSRQAVLAETHGNVALAQQFWQAAIDAEKTDAPENAAWARVQLGNLHFTIGDLNAAKDEYSEALAVFPDYSHAQAGLAKVAAANGDYTRALDLFAKATTRFPNPVYLAELADVQAKAGRAAEAARTSALIGAIGQLFEANGIRNDLTLMLFALDHGQVTRDTVERARVAYDERPSLAAADVYAWALYRVGRFDEASTHADEALRLGTKEPLYLFHAGMIAAARGDAAAGSGYLSAALKLNSKFSVIFTDEAVGTLKILQRAK